MKNFLLKYEDIRQARESFRHLAASQSGAEGLKRFYFTAAGYQIEFGEQLLETTSLKTAVDTYNLLDFDQFGKGDWWDTFPIGKNGAIKLQVQKIDEPTEHDPLESDEIACFLARCSGMKVDSDGFVL